MPTQCLFCLELKDNTIAITETHFTCCECVEDHIVPRFHQALNYEANYPVVVGEATLEPQQFLHWLKVPFVLRWIRRKEEYGCTSRTYCKHVIKKASVLPVGEYANQRHALNEKEQADLASQNIPTTACGGFVAEKTDNFGVARCMRCHGSVATCCGAAVWDLSIRHACNSQPSNPLAGKIRGKDYQICPICATTYQLAGGCNHMKCESGCLGNFCYICGERDTTANSGHWNIGSQCPRFGHPDDENPLFDDPDVMEINDAEVDGGDDDNESRGWPVEFETFRDEHGILLARLSTAYGRDAQIFVPLTRLQQTTRAHLDQLAEENNEMPEYPPWLSIGPLYDPLVMIGLALPNVAFCLLIHDGDVNGQLDHFDILPFFDHREAFGTAVVEALMPRRRREPPPYMGGRRPTPDEDVVIDITTVNPHEHRFYVELHHIGRFLGLSMPERGEGTPDSGPLIPEFESILVNFSGDLDALRVDQASFQPITMSDAYNMDAIRGTNALIDALNDEVHGRTDLLVRDILMHFHNHGWTVRE